MKNINLEKDIVNAKENSIETFGVILGWIGAISLVGSVEENLQIINGSPVIGDDKTKELVNEQDDFFQTIWVPAINNSYIVLNAIWRSIYKDPIPKRFESLFQSGLLKDNIIMYRRQIGNVPFAKNTLGSRCYSDYLISVNALIQEIQEKRYFLSTNEDDSELYLIATEEVEGDKRIEALWTKCIVLNKGDESLAKYEYIAKRVELLTLEKDKENAKLSSAAEFADILKSFDQILRKFTSPILQALVTSIASMTIFSKEDGGSDLENNFLERINEIYSLTEDDLEFALSIMGIEGRVSKSANGNFKYYFLDGGSNDENSITSESSRKIYRERRDQLSKSVTFVEYEKTLKEEPVSLELLESMLGTEAVESIEGSMKNDKGHDWWGIAKAVGVGVIGGLAAGSAGKSLGKKLGQTTYTTARGKLGRPFESEEEQKWRRKEEFINRNKKYK